jgi:hypothetical protein
MTLLRILPSQANWKLACLLLNYHSTVSKVNSMDIEQSNIEYRIAGQLEFVKGSGGFPFILISDRSATA